MSQPQNTNANQNTDATNPPPAQQPPVQDPNQAPPAQQQQKPPVVVNTGNQEVLTRLDGLPEKLANVFKEMLPAATPPAQQQQQAPAKQPPDANQPPAKPAAATGRRSFADWYHGRSSS